jgi:hypothetical protein
MKFEKIAALAIEALEARRKAWAPEANMLLKMGIDSYSTQRAAKHYAELTEAIEELKELGKRTA